MAEYTDHVSGTSVEFNDYPEHFAHITYDTSHLGETERDRDISRIQNGQTVRAFLSRTICERIAAHVNVTKAKESEPEFLDFLRDAGIELKIDEIYSDLGTTKYIDVSVRDDHEVSRMNDEGCPH